MRAARGFTLLELLVSMTLVGFILVLLFAGLRLGSQSWDVAENQINASSQRAIVMNLIRRMLEQSVPLRWNDNGVESIAFEADAESLSFVGPVASREGLSGNHLVRLRLAEGESGRNLILQWRLTHPAEHDFAALDTSEPKPLLKAVQSLQFDYYGAEDEIQEPAWRSDWRDRTRLPDLVRMRITLLTGEQLPDLLVAPRLQAE